MRKCGPQFHTAPVVRPVLGGQFGEQHCEEGADGQQAALQHMQSARQHRLDVGRTDRSRTTARAASRWRHTISKGPPDLERALARLVAFPPEQLTGIAAGYWVAIRAAYFVA